MSTELSGVDLARQALLAAQETAKKNGASARRPKRSTGTTVRRDGREPLGLGAAITAMMAERGMVAPAAGGNVLAQFDAIVAAAAPELTGHVQAMAFDPDTGRLDVAPDAPAYGTQLRWCAPKLIAAANERVQDVKVRAVHVLAPAPVKAGPAAAAVTSAPQPAMPAATVARRTPPEGYHRAIAAHHQAFRPPQLDPAIAAAVARQTRAMRELSRRAFPETDIAGPGDAPTSFDAARSVRRRQAEVFRAAALRRARQEGAARGAGPAISASEPAGLRDTA